MICRNPFCHPSEGWDPSPLSLRVKCEEAKVFASARLIEGFCEQCETKDPMSGQFL